MSTHASTRSRLYYVLLIVLLLLLLAGLAVAYRTLVKPPMLAGENPDGEGYRHGFSLYGFGPERLSRPSDVAIGEDGRIYVADTFNHRVVVYDERGRYVQHFGEYGEEPLDLAFPSGVAVASNGTVFVLCKGADKVVIFDPSHQPQWVIDVESPQVATVVADRLYLATHRGIMIGDLQGSLITAFGRRGREAGSIDHPGGIAVDSGGTIYISDSLNYRVQALDEDGKALWVAGEAAGGADAIRSSGRRFGLPAGIAIGDDGLLYLVDAFTGTIQVLDPADGTELTRYGEWGHEDGKFYYPAGFSHGQGDVFAIADKFNDRIQVLNIYSPLEPPFAARLRSPALWFLPLALLPLLFLLVRRRHVADRWFLAAVTTAEAVPELGDSVNRIDVTREIREGFVGVSQGGVHLDRLLREASPRKRAIVRMAQRHELDIESAGLLARAKRPLRLPSVLLADGPALQEAARLEGVLVMSSSDVLRHWGRETLPAASMQSPVGAQG